MRLAVMQPYFFPSAGYFQTLMAVDRFVLHDGLSYIKEGFMHRNRILTGHGALQITVPVVARSSHRLIAETRADDSQPWRRRLARQLQQSYGRSPFFAEVFPRVAAVIDAPTDHLARLNAASIAMVHEYLDLPCVLVPDASAYRGIEARLQEEYAPDATPQPLRRMVRRAIEMCRLEGATGFVNAIGGRALYDPALFAAHGITLRFVHSELPEYPQFNSRSFVPRLSVLDLLFNCPRDQARDLLTRYRLIS